MTIPEPLDRPEEESDIGVGGIVLTRAGNVCGAVSSDSTVTYA